MGKDLAVKYIGVARAVRHGNDEIGVICLQLHGERGSAISDVDHCPASPRRKNFQDRHTRAVHHSRHR